MFSIMFGYFYIILCLHSARSFPVPFRDLEPRQSLVSDFNSHLASLSPRLQGQEPRFPLPPLPSAQEIEAIKKVAQILVTLGEQVIPTIIGEPPTSKNCNSSHALSAVDVPNDEIDKNTRNS